MYSRTHSILLGCTLLAAMAGCSRSPSSVATVSSGTAPTSYTEAAQAAVAAKLNLADRQDFEDARRGWMAKGDGAAIKDSDGQMVWDFSSYHFESGSAPTSVNPSLWRQAQLNNERGLFQVTEGIYQVRGFDLSNLTLIQGQSGWIVVDPLTSRETAAAAMALARGSLGEIRVVAVILTHSHVDHFGGIAAVLPDDPARRAQIQIVAPKAFLEEATSENVLAGVVMGRRASFMYGSHLPRHPNGHVDSGLGKGPAMGQVDISAPTQSIDHTGQELTIDGVPFVFQYVPDSEAPAELTFYLPAKKAFCAAEIATHTMHNLYTLRGAKVRDAMRWSGYIDEALDRFADAEVVFASHHWPVWGHDRVVDFLAKQRDTYKFIHDQTLRLASDGGTSQEIAEEIELPASLSNTFAVRGYYGTTRHNSKAVYQAYFGWFDGNPANLDPLPPVPAAQHYVEAMGGAVETLAKGQKAFDAGEYRWAAMLLNHLVFAQPDNKEARELLARTYDQLGYQAESGPWRDVYLTGAQELRRGPGTSAIRMSTVGSLLRQMPTDRFFDAMAVHLIGPKAEGKTITVNFEFTDLGETHVVNVSNSVLHHKKREADANADATIRLTKEILVKLVTKQLGVKEALTSDELSISGSRLTLASFFSLLDNPEGNFPIVTP